MPEGDQLPPLERCLFWGEIAVLDMFNGQDTKHNFMGMNPHHSSVFYSCRPESMGCIYTFLPVQVHGNSVITESCVLAPDHITQAGGLSPEPLLEILGELKNFFE